MISLSPKHTENMYPTYRACSTGTFVSLGIFHGKKKRERVRERKEFEKSNACDGARINRSGWGIELEFREGWALGKPAEVLIDEIECSRNWVNVSRKNCMENG